MMIHTMPIAFSLFLQYCRHQSLEMVEKMWEQEDNPTEMAFTKIIRSYDQDTLDARSRILEDSGNCFHRMGHVFNEKQCEEQVKLLRHQRRLEDEMGVTFVDLSLQQTLHKLTLEGAHLAADKLRKEFKVPDKRQMQEAADQAFESKNEDDLTYVLGKVKVTDRQLAENVRQMIGQLSSRR